MLEKKIADQLRNHEVDPQDAGLFEKIMQERGKRSSKTGFLLIGSIALMFTLITGLGLSNYWGKIPQDGYSKEQIAAIRKREAKEAEGNQIRENLTKEVSPVLNPNQRKEENNRNVSQENTNGTALSNAAKGSENSVIDISNQESVNLPPKSEVQEMDSELTVVSKESNQSNTGKIKKTRELITPYERKITPIKTQSILAEAKQNRTKSDPIFIGSKSRVLKPLAHITIHEGSLFDVPTDKTKETEGSETDNNGKLYPFWPREINFFVGSYYNQRFINTAGNAVGQKIADLEKVSSTHFIGLNLEYKIKKSIFGQVGVQWLTVNHSILAHQNQTINHRTETIVDPGGTSRTIDIYDTSNTRYAGTKNTNNFFEIPLTLGARWQIKRHIIQPQFGIVSSFYTSSNGTAFNNQGELQSLSGKQNMFRNVNIQAITGFTYTYIIGSRVGLYVQPNLRYGLTNQAKNSYSFSQYNSMVGGQFGLKYILK